MRKQLRSSVRAALGVAAVLLAAGGADARPPHKGTAMARAKTVTLTGAVRGTWRRGPSADRDGEYDLSGNGQVGPLGMAQAAGSLRAPGPDAKGRTAGTFTLTTPNGSLTLSLSGPAPSIAADTAPLPAPASLTYSVTGGAGVYRGDHGHGTAQLLMTPQRRPPHIPGRMMPHYIIAAMFTLTFGAAPAPGAVPSKASSSPQ